MLPMTMLDKTVVVTGASSGVGLATALLLAEQGAEVAMICRDAIRGRLERVKALVDRFTFPELN